MLKKAKAEHFTFIRNLIIHGAQEGAFDATLATQEAEMGFFHPLADALDSGYVTQDGRTSRLHAYVYFNAAKENKRPLGFAIFIGDGHLMEFWMAAIDPVFRRQGLGELMFAEALRNVGARNVLTRCGPGAEGAAHIFLKKLGFIHLGTGPEGTRFLIDRRMSAELRAKLQKTFEA